MAYLIAQSATSNVDLLDKLKLFATGKSATAAVVNAGGTGYTVGDVLTLSGGTFTIAAQLIVTTVSSGVITAVRISQSGVYTVTPSNPVSVSGGTGSSATFTMTFNSSNGWTLKRRTKKASSATVGSGGSGYTNGDTLTVPNTSAGGTASTWTATVSAGAVTSVALVTAGNYHETPSNPAATTGGTGTGATLNVTYIDGTDETDQQLILEGVGSGSDQVFVGIRTFLNGSSRNWELAGFTGYSPTGTWETQPGISPGRNAAAGPTGEGAYVPLSNSTITYWMFINGRRIIGEFKVSTTYTNMYLGFFNPFGTTLEFPYPLAVFGCSSAPSRNFADTVIGFSGMLDPIGADGHTSGPAFIRDINGTWKTVKNSTQSGSGRNRNDDLVIWPAGSPGKTGLLAEDTIGNDVYFTLDFIPGTGNPGTQTDRVLQTPGSGVNLSLLIPNMIIEEGDGGVSLPRMVHGELDNIFWTTSNLDQDSTTATSEDVFLDGSDRYHFFQNCRRTDQWAFFVIKQE